MSGFGKAKWGTSGGCPTWTIKGGDNIYRILPPMHSLADQGKWSNYDSSHWGYEIPDPRNPGKTRAQTFRCIRLLNRQTRMVEQDCPECELHATREQALEAATAQARSRYQSEGKADLEIKGLLDKEFGGERKWLFAHNVDRKHYLAAMDRDRKFGHAKINHTDKKKLDLKFAELRSQGIDPLDLAQGVWVNFKRISDKGTDDLVEIVTERVEATVGGKQVQLSQVVIAPLSNEEADRALEEVRDLTTVGGLVLTKEQILLLTQKGEDPDEADLIFKMGGSKRQPEVSPSSPSPQAPNLDSPEALARLTAILERKAAETKAAEKQRASVAAVANGTVATLVSENPAGSYTMSDDDFLALVQAKTP